MSRPRSPAARTKVGWEIWKTERTKPANGRGRIESKSVDPWDLAEASKEIRTWNYFAAGQESSMKHRDEDGIGESLKQRVVNYASSWSWSSQFQAWCLRRQKCKNRVRCSLNFRWTRVALAILSTRGILNLTRIAISFDDAIDTNRS